MSGKRHDTRTGNPVLLTEQIFAWQKWREGWCICDIAVMLRRSRRIVHGDPLA